MAVVELSPSLSRFRFGDVTLVPDEHLVLKNGRPVQLTPKAFDLLLVFVENSGRLLTKEQLMHAVWGDTAVEEANLSYHVFAIRKALADADNGRYIQTVPSRGYRFTAPVERITGDSQPSRAPVVPTGAHPLGWRWAVVAGSAVLAAILYVVIQWSRPSPDAEPLRAIPLTSMPGAVRGPSLSPDGSYVVFSWKSETQSNSDLYVQHVGAGGPLRLTTEPGDDYSPSWSPDGRTVAFLRRGPAGGSTEVRLIPPLGGAERKLADIKPGLPRFLPDTLSWCPDSTCLLVIDSPGAGKLDAVFAISLDSGEKRQLTYPTEQTGPDADPVISPDGRSLVFRRDSTPFSGSFYRLALTDRVTPGGAPLRLTSTLPAGRPTWMPDSRQILFSARGALWRLDALRGGAPARLPFVGEDGLTPVVSRTVDARQRLVYVRSFADANVWRVDTTAPGVPAQAVPAVAIASTRIDAIPSLSPDGRRLAFLSNRSGESEIWVADEDGTNAVQLTSFGRHPGFPRWSPDGKLIAFHGDLRDRPDVVVLPAGGGQPRILTSSLTNAGYPSFSRDGHSIYFCVVQDKHGRIWKVPSAGGEPVQVTSNAGTLSMESPDGRDLYYAETTERPSAVWRQPVAGGAPVKVLDGAVLGNFDVVDGGIYYITRVLGEAGAFLTDCPGGDTRLQYFDFSKGSSVTVAHNLGTVGFGLSASRDGRRVFFTRIDSSVDELMRVENFR